MNPYKSTAIRLSVHIELGETNRKEIKEWITSIIEKSTPAETWMHDIFQACELTEEKLIRALNAVPFSSPEDEAWETLLRKPIIKK